MRQPQFLNTLLTREGVTMAPSWTQPSCSPMGRGVLLLGLGLSFLLQGLLLPCADCNPQTAWDHAAYEIVIPRKLAPSAGKGSKEEVSYGINIQGIAYTIHLRQKDWIIKDFPVFARDSHGKMKAKQPRVPVHCYYDGYIEGILNSAVTLTVCSGLRGLLQFGNSSYSIEPLPGATKGQHLLLRRDAALPGTMYIYDMPVERQWFPRPSKEAEGQFQLQGHTRYMELFVVVDKEGFDALGRGITNVTLEVIEILNLVDGMFKSFHLRVMVTALEIWVEKNPISITKSINRVLYDFNHWRKQSLKYAMHDVGCLFASVDFGHGIGGLPVSGKSNLGSACNKNRASAVVSFARQPYMETAVSVARVLGYALGMAHDHSYCTCGNSSRCIMSVNSTVNYVFSNCSKRHYFDFISSGRGFCLNNIPESVMTSALRRCKNRVLMPGDMCKSDPCCDIACQRKGALCTSGRCCRNCKPLPEGEVCRESAGPCDLPEYCNGTSEHCPADVAKQDGTVCAEDGFCYSGKCRSPTLQCMSIFGEEAKPAPLACFQEVNMKGDRFGNCFGDGADISFQKCKLENVLCGRMQCVNVRRLPRLEDHTTVIQTPVGDTWCWGTDYHLGVDILDPGLVKDGMQCGEKKICINRTCVPEGRYLTSRCSAKKTCRGKGICNTNGNCHCDNGWAPPDCQYIGFGGSIDSGPAPVTKHGLWRLLFGVIGITTAVLVLAAIAIVEARKFGVTQALHTYVGSFWVEKWASKGDVSDQMEEDDSEPAESTV
ncbi:disintegrin and metalloproteinase domain-containing protein 9-like isoform 1-T1 [Amazona ochrocephala]